MANEIDVTQTVNEYLNQNDWRVKANANQGYSIGGLILNGAGKLIGNYWLNEVYPEKISTLHKNGHFYIHDLDFLGGYCAGWSLRNLLNEGFNGVNGKISSSPPKHLSSAMAQMVNFLGTLQNEWAGAQAFNSVDTLLAPFIPRDELTKDEVKQIVQTFIYDLNVPSRWGNQTPFTNITLDLTCPDDLKDQYVWNDGSEYTYGDFQKYMDMFNECLFEILLEGDASGRAFSYPIPTINVTNSFNWDTNVGKLISKVTAKYGTPYFSNFVNSSLNPSDVRSMCCRLRLDLTKLESKKGGGLFGSGDQTGSIGVVTLNMARLGLISTTKENLFKRLKDLLDAAVESLEIKRAFLVDALDKGLYPYTKRYLGIAYRNHFSTIGVNGMHEMCKRFFNDEYGITSEEGSNLSKECLNFIRDYLEEVQKNTGHLYNLEATPAEGASYRLAQADKKLFNTEEEYYTNSSQLPVNYSSDPYEVLEHQTPLQSLYTGGTVQHFFLGEQIAPELVGKFIMSVFNNCDIPYITLTPTFSICPEHGYLSGSVKICPTCQEKTEVWSRVMGYYRPTSSYNAGKKVEYNNRKMFNLERK